MLIYLHFRCKFDGQNDVINTAPPLEFATPPFRREMKRKGRFKTVEEDGGR
jgi:hypothetical protein